MCYCPTPTLHLNLALTGDCAFLLSPQKTHSVWFISVLNYGDTENVLINHLLLVIPMSYPCHYTNLCPHKPHKHAHTHTHTHTESVFYFEWNFKCISKFKSKTILVKTFLRNYEDIYSERILPLHPSPCIQSLISVSHLQVPCWLLVSTPFTREPLHGWEFK